VILESRIFAQAGMVSVQKNVLHGKRPQIVPLLSGEQPVRHADIEFFRACRYQLFTRGHQGCPGVEDIVNDHGAALHLSHRHVVHNSALGSMFFEANQIFRISSGGHHCLAARNCALVTEKRSTRHSTAAFPGFRGISRRERGTPGAVGTTFCLVHCAGQLSISHRTRKPSRLLRVQAVARLCPGFSLSWRE